MHRRARRLRRGETAGRRHHRARMHGELDFEGALRERVRLLSGLDERIVALCLPSGCAPTRAPKRWCAPCAPAARRPCSCPGGFTAFAVPGRRAPRLRTGRGQPPRFERRPAQWKRVGPDRRCCLQGARLEQARDALGIGQDACWRSATAPTTGRWSKRRGWGSPTAPSPRLPQSPTPGSITTASTPCCGRRAFPRAEWIEA